MKICTLTFYNSRNNYGQILQCYALQHYLKQQGHESCCLLFSAPSPPSLGDRVRRQMFRLFKSLNPYYFYYYCKQIREKRQEAKEVLAGRLFEDSEKRGFNSFRKEYIAFTAPVPVEFEKLKDKYPPFDAYIVGSDTVWNASVSSCRGNPFYLNFLPDDILKISYAPSFGGSKPHKKFISALTPYLQKFNAVSVREKSGLEICRAAGRRDAVRVIDPSGLLTMDDYLDLCGNIPVKSGKSLFLYILNFDTPEQVRYDDIKSFCKKKSLELLVNISDGLIPASDRLPGANYSFATIPEWLAHYRDAEYIITNSFHGTMFAVIFHKPFLVLPLLGRFESYNVRQFSLLEELGLLSRVFSPGKGTLEEQMGRPIDWNAVQRLFSSFRDNSKKFLDNALGEIKIK